MIASWIFELLRRERDWRAALPRITAHLSDLPEDRVRAGLELGAAFEHIEPNRYHAITAYQLAGPRRDKGRSRKLAVEIGWWQAEGRLATIELRATGAPEALLSACRALIDDGKTDAARNLFDEHASDDPMLEGLRSELDDRGRDWATYAINAKQLKGREAAEAHVTAARLARAFGEKRWVRQLESALEADPTHDAAASMLLDQATASEDDKLVFDVMRLRLLGLDGYEYCDGLRAIATRLLLADPSHHAGMGRRLAKTVLERAYAAALVDVPGHLALWSLLDAAAAQDGTRTELLPLILKGLDTPIPNFDRTWIAALGAAICVEAGSNNTARSYASIVAEHASSHPIVRELLEEAEETDGLDLSDELELLEEDAESPPVESLVPDDDLGLAPVTMSNGMAVADGPSASAPDPRFIDVRVRALDDPPEGTPSRPPEPKLPKPPSPAPLPAPPPAALAQVAADAKHKRPDALDDEWDVDDELFPRRRRSSQISVAEPLPQAPVAEAPPEPPAPAAAPAPAAPPKPAAPTPPAGVRVSSLIPAAAKKVLEQSGTPRALPKLPQPINARPRADRVSIAVDVVIRHAGKTIHAHTRDLSTSGLFAITNETLDVGTALDCELRIPTPNETGATTLAVRARVVRKDPNGFGLWFVQPSPELIQAIGAHLAR